MKTKDLKINFRYLGGNIACLSVDSIVGKSIHNDINNEEAIIIFNSLVGEKENCQTVKKLLQENQELKEKLDKYENPKDMTLFAMWCTEKVKDENEKLKEEITNLSKEIDMWNAKYNDMFDENRMLKKRLEEWEHHLKCSREMLDIQGQKGNYDYDEYMLGVYNGMECIIALFETREPNFINGKDVEFTNNKTQQKEFIKWLEDYINLFDKKDIYEEGSFDMLEEILNKYKEIIGVSDENNMGK